MPDYFDIAELRALPDMDNVSKYPTTRVEAVAAQIVGIIEREVGTSFILREVTDETHDGGCDQIVLNDFYAKAAISATVDGDAVTDDLVIRRGILLRLSGSSLVTWATGYSNVTVTYDAGYSETPPDDIKEAALKGTRAHLMATSVSSSISDRQTSLSAGDSVINFVVAGADRPTGYPDVDATILGWKRKLNVGGFA